MTALDLYEQLKNIPSIVACNEYVMEHILEIADLFTGISDENLKRTKFDFEDAFLLLDELIHTSQEPPTEPLTALLLFFSSMFERAGLHTNIQRVAADMPDDYRRKCLMVIYLFKSITDTSTEYRARFHEICTLLDDAANESDIPRVRSLCEDLLIEYYAEGIVQNEKLGMAAYTLYHDGFNKPDLIARYPLLNAARFRTVWTLPYEQLETDLVAANQRVAEAFFDDAMARVPLAGIDAGHDPCCAAGTDCTDGFHGAKRAIFRQYPEAYARTGVFVRQELTGVAYEQFADHTQCMRYLRQYMPLHLPQLEEAVRRSLANMPPDLQQVRLLDVGSGPGTLYCALSRLINAGEVNGRVFQYHPLEPSSGFIDFLNVIARHVTADGLAVGAPHCGRLSDLDDNVFSNINWIFLGNAVTPLITYARGDVGMAATHLVEKALLSNEPHLRITLAENSKTYKFDEFCQAIEATNQFIMEQLGDVALDAPWLAGCHFRSQARFIATRPVLKLCNFIRR